MSPVNLQGSCADRTAMECKEDQTPQNKELGLKLSLRASFGFTFDPDLSMQKNVNNIIGDMPLDLYFTQASIIAYHNLCLTKQPPISIKSLLGLSLKFIPNDKFTHGIQDFNIDRFSHDSNLRMFFAHSADSYKRPPFWVPSDLQPWERDIPILFRTKISNFIEKMHSLFKKKRNSINLLFLQQHALRFLRHTSDFVVLKMDKNLGPAILERDIYMQKALAEHLSETATYRHLTESESQGRLRAIECIICSHVSKFHSVTRENYMGLETREHTEAGKFIIYLLNASLSSDPFAYFYLLPKVHKTPWSTRPIVSVSGSITYGIAKWLDITLQDNIAQIPFTVWSSAEFVNQIHSLGTVPSNCLLCTVDTTSMYTNIDTSHTLEMLSGFLRTSPFASGVDAEACLDAIRIIMRHNIFRFSASFWVQKNGTAMGTPPAPAYAQLYFLIHELTFLHTYTQLCHYVRYLDDIFLIWEPDPNPIKDEADWAD